MGFNRPYYAIHFLGRLSYFYLSLLLCGSIILSFSVDGFGQQQTNGVGRSTMHGGLKTTTTCFLFSSGNKDNKQGREVEIESSKQQKEKSSETTKNVNFCAPLLDYGYPSYVQEFENDSLSEKPLLLYLPGFDGTDLCPFIQFPELGTEFEVWCMTVGMNDRSTFEELKNNVLDFLNEIQSSISIESQEGKTDQSTKSLSVNGKSLPEKNSVNFLNSVFGSSSLKQKKRPIYLAGESFGGIVAAEVALTLLKEQKDDVDLKGLVLINPATCYDRSSLASRGPAVANMPGLAYPFGLMQLLPLFADAFSFEQLLLILQAKALPSVIDTPAREAYMGRVAFSLPTKLEYMSQGTLKWRLEQWLEVGCARIESRLFEFMDLPGLKNTFGTLIIAGENDLTLPSIAEAERLVNLLPNSQVHVVERAGHASTCGSRMDMTAVLRAKFPELLQHNKEQTKDKKKGNSQVSTEAAITTQSATTKARTAMKPEAAEGKGAYFGMTKRYDGANIGLNPLLYWSKANFRSTRRNDMERSAPRVMYRKASYSIRRPSSK